MTASELQPIRAPAQAAPSRQQNCRLQGTLEQKLLTGGSSGHFWHHNQKPQNVSVRHEAPDIEGVRAKPKRGSKAPAAKGSAMALYAKAHPKF